MTTTQLPDIRLAPVRGWRAYALGIQPLSDEGWRWCEVFSPWLALWIVNPQLSRGDQARTAQLLAACRPSADWQAIHRLADQQRALRHLRGPLLVGGYGQVWPGPRLRARCVQDAAESARLASQHLRAGACRCGIYVTQEPAAPTLVQAFVIARVTGWGYAVEHARGWRCEAVAIEELYVPTFLPRQLPALVDRLHERYRLPIRPLRELRARYPDAAFRDYPRLAATRRQAADRADRTDTRRCAS